MAKLFYSVEEAVQRLGVSESELHDMVSKGQLQEFRSGDKLVFKRDQVDLIAGSPEDEGHPGGSSMIPLADSGELDITLSESAFGTEPIGGGSGEGTGVAIFEADDLDEADPSAQTQVSSGPAFEGFSSEPGASGSGLMDLTQAADDTSLGEGFLEDAYSGSGGFAAQGEPAAEGGALFESTGAASDPGEAMVAGGMVASIAAEPYDGPGSGLTGGLAMGMILTLGFAMAMVIMGMVAGPGNKLVEMVSDQFWVFVGASAGVTVVFGLIGMLMLRKST